MSLRTVVFAASMVLAARLATAEPPASAKVVLGRHDDRVAVTVEGEEFTSYRFTGHDKPILYPLRAPGGVPLTRSWPIEKGVAGEPEDHPHHESLWFTHGSVNGLDFWAPRAHGAGPDGPIPHVEHVSIDRCESGETPSAAPAACPQLLEDEDDTSSRVDGECGAPTIGSTA